MARSFQLRANAKINLHLQVGPRRRDGYHSLDTVFQEISLSDTLEFTKHPRGIRLTVVGARLSGGKDNLIVRALEALRAKAGITEGIAVRLKKKIPMGAGLGGGSADAAAALRGGWALWHGGKEPAYLPALAKKLGADVPFFLKGGRARGRGIGEKLTPIRNYRRQWLVVVYPNVHVPTGPAYGWLDALRRGKPERHPREIFWNSFEAAVLPRFPVIRKTKEALIQAGLTQVLMSGSGASVFGAAASRRKAEQVKRKLRRTGWKLFVCKML